METLAAALAAGVYNRVSDDRKGRSKSPEEQNEESAAACREQGWRIAATYTEPESASASRFARKAREEWERLCADLKAGLFGVLVVWETSRSTRRMAPFVDLLDACRERGVLIHVTSHDRTYDPRQWRDRKALLQDGIDNEGGSEETSLRVSRSTRSRAAKGLPAGRLLYGYRREYEHDDDGKRHFLREVPREERAEIVREAFRRFDAGESLWRISCDLEDRGVPVSNVRRRRREAHWTAVRLRQLLTNPGYIGKRVHQGEIVGDAVWPPLVGEETFYSVQRRLGDEKRRQNRGDVHDKHLLSGVALCGTCGAFLRKVPNHSHRMVYQCRGYGGDPSKGRFCTSIVAEVLETHVTGMVLLRLSLPDARELFTADRSAEAAEAAAALLRTRAELEDLYALARAKKLSARAMAEMEPPLLADMAALESKASAQVPPLLRDVAGPDAAERWAQLSLDQKKDVMRAIMTVRLHKAGKRSRAAEGGGIDGAYIRERIEVGWTTA